MVIYEFLSSPPTPCKHNMHDAEPFFFFKNKYSLVFSTIFMVIFGQVIGVLNFMCSILMI